MANDDSAAANDNAFAIIATQTNGFSGAAIQVATQYNSNGNVAETSRPYFVASGTPQWTTFAYDVLNRVTESRDTHYFQLGNKG